jgi:DNA primase
MSQYFTRQLLYRLRNEIPIAELIADHLDWPSKLREGRFVFVCPRCGETLSGVNPKTNLSRCFRCEENFNTIDFVMLATKRDFVEAVEFLTELLPTAAGSASQATPPTSIDH